VIYQRDSPLTHQNNNNNNNNEVAVNPERGGGSSRMMDPVRAKFKTRIHETDPEAIIRDINLGMTAYRQLHKQFHVSHSWAQLFSKKQYPIEEGAILISKLANSSASPESVNHFIHLASNLTKIKLTKDRYKTIPEETNEQKRHQKHQINIIKALNEVLFNDLGFDGLKGTAEPSDSLITEVISRKTGLPITLSVLYMAIAIKLDLKLRGVALPGTFIVRLDDSEVFIEVSNKGCFVDRKAIIEFVQGRGGKLEDALQFLEGVPPERIYLRMVENLRASSHKHLEFWDLNFQVIELWCSNTK